MGSRYALCIEKLIKAAKRPGVKLNIGCGRDIRKGFVNCDKRKGSGVDKIVDLEKKLSFKSGYANTILY